MLTKKSSGSMYKFFVPLIGASHCNSGTTYFAYVEPVDAYDACKATYIAYERTQADVGSARLTYISAHRVAELMLSRYGC